MLAPLRGALFISDTFATHFFKEQVMLHAAIFPLWEEQEGNSSEAFLFYLVFQFDLLC